jgi:hypothetical protein
MKKKVAILCVILFASLAAAQTLSPDSEGVPPLRGVYFHSPSGWIGLPTNTLLPLENGTAKWLLGFGRGDAIAETPGPHAAVQTSMTKPTFYMRGFPPSNGIYVIREIEKQDYREIRMAVSGDFREWAHVRAGDIIPIDMRHAGGNVMAVTPRADLKPGEYAIVTAFDPNVRSIHVSFDFGVSP